MPEKILVIAYRARARGNTFLQLKVEDATVGPEMP